MDSGWGDDKPLSGWVCREAAGQKPQNRVLVPIQGKEAGSSAGGTRAKTCQAQTAEAKTSSDCARIWAPKCVRNAMHPKERPEKLKMISFSVCVFFFWGGLRSRSTL